MTPAEAENTIIGMLMVKNENIAEAIGAGLKPWHFDTEECRDAFAACQGLWVAGEPASVHRVALKMGRQHEQWLMNIREHAPIGQNVSFYIRVAKDKHRAKELYERLVQFGVSLAQRDLADRLDPLLEQIVEVVLSPSASSEKIRSLPIPAAVDESLADAEKRRESFIAGDPIGIPFGFPTVDLFTAGMHPGNVYIIGARTGVGKTTLAANIAINAAKAGAMTAYVTVEMSAKDISDKMLCREARVDLRRYLNGEFSNDEATRVADAAAVIGNLPLIIDEAIVPTFEALSSEIARLVQVEKVELVIVDYLQQFELDDARYRPPREVTKIISTGLKTLAKKHKIALLVLSQLSREAPESGPPDLRHIAESDQIARDADVVMLLFRDGAGTFVRVAKQRRGMCGTVLLKAELEYGALSEDRAIQ